MREGRMAGAAAAAAHKYFNVICSCNTTQILVYTNDLSLCSTYTRFLLLSGMTLSLDDVWGVLVQHVC